EDTADLRRDFVMRTLDHLAGDLRFAIRSLRLAPGFTAVALTTLIVGIGAVSALFSVLYAYAFRPLPYKDADRIVAVQEQRPRGFIPYRAMTVEAAKTLGAESRSFERVTMFREQIVRATVAGRATSLLTLQIDSSFAPMFGIRPLIGRSITSDEIRSR